MDTKCPYCGEEMVLGYIRSRDGVVWAKDPSGISSLPWLASGPMVSPHCRCGGANSVRHTYKNCSVRHCLTEQFLFYLSRRGRLF